MYIQLKWLLSLGIPRSTLYRWASEYDNRALGMGRRFIHIDDAIQILRKYLIREKKNAKEKGETLSLISVAIFMLEDTKNDENNYVVSFFPCPQIGKTSIPCPEGSGLANPARVVTYWLEDDLNKRLYQYSKDEKNAIK